jgi:copper chaperone CopZ
MATTRRFGVTGMTCGGCERALGRAVSQLPGVESVTASHAEQAVHGRVELRLLMLRRLVEIPAGLTLSLAHAGLRGGDFV